MSARQPSEIDADAHYARDVGLWAVLSLALALRIAVTIVTRHSNLHPDEIFDYLEQAYRLTNGYGVWPWTYRDGIRNWLFPLLLAAPMRLGSVLSPDSDLYLLLPKIAVATLSVGIVWAAYDFGRSLSRTHAILAGFAAAIWSELVLFAAHPLTETVSGAFFMIGAALLLNGRHALRLSIAGFIFGLAVLLRFQHLPAAGLLLLLVLRLDVRRWIPVAIGGVTALVASGLTDIATGQTPFLWLIENLRINLLEHRADVYGTAPPLAYLIEIVAQWGGCLLFIFPLMVLGARRHPALFWAASINLAFHMAIAHKEYRFVFLSLTLFVVLAGLGTGELLADIRARWPCVPRRALVTGALALWIFCSADIAFSGNVIGRWQPNAPMMQIYRDAGRLPGLCGVAIYRLEFWRGGGYVELHHNVPMFHILPPGLPTAGRDPQASLREVEPSANALIARPAMQGELPSAYKLVGCRRAKQDNAQTVNNVCVFLRPGTCAVARKADVYEVNHQLLINDW